MLVLFVCICQDVGAFKLQETVCSFCPLSAQQIATKLSVFAMMLARECVYTDRFLCGYLSSPSTSVSRSV